MYAVLLSLLLLAAPPAPKILLVAGSANNPTAQGLAALGIEHVRLGAGQYGAVSPFDYDLLIWGMDESRGILAAHPEVIRTFVEAGGVLLGFRGNDLDPWLPSPMQRDKAFQLGPLLAPNHPVFNTPHTLDRAALAEVHGGSIYRAFWDLGPGWIPLVATGAEQGWDKTPATDADTRYGLVELPLG